MTLLNTAHLIGQHRPPHLDALMLFGFLSAILTILLIIYGRNSKSALRALAVSLVANATYGFLQGAWPLGMTQCILAIIVFHTSRRPRAMFCPRLQHLVFHKDPSRMNRMFGPSSFN